MLRLRRIHKRYRTLTALQDVSCDLPSHKITGIVGPNGAGKSTLLKIIAGFELPDQGEVWWARRQLATFQQRAAVIAFMPEQLDLYPGYTVAEWLSFFHRASGWREPALLDTLELPRVAAKRIKELSKGYRQRLKFYLALSAPKPLVVLDEPFDGFDPIQVVEIMALLGRERDRGKTLVLSIHQLAEAQKICEHFVFLNEGRVKEQGSFHELRARHGVRLSLEDVFRRVLK